MSHLEVYPSALNSDRFEMVALGSIVVERAERASLMELPALSVGKLGVTAQLEGVAKQNSEVLRKVVRKGDLVINSRADRKGAAGLSLYEGSVSPVYSVMIPKAELLSAKYGHYLLRSVAFQEEFFRWGTGIVSDLWSTNFTRMARIRVPLPPLTIQNSIASYLDRETGEIDAMLAALDELTRNLKQRSGIVVANELKSHYLHGTIPLAFSSGADNFFDGDWVESKDQDPDGDIRLLQLADIGDGTFLDKSNRRINQEAFERLRCREVRAGDILIARMPHPLGRACILPTGLGRTITVVDVAVLRPDPNRVIPKYLVYVLNSISFRAQLDSLQSGSTRQRISRSRLGQQRIPMPPVALQRAAVSHLDEVTGRIDAMLATIDELKALLVERRAALITDVVTGRKKVPA